MPLFFLKATPKNDQQEPSQEQQQYWHGLLASHTALTYGRVKDPKGAYWVATVEVENEAAVEELMKKDPAKSWCTIEHYPLESVHKAQPETSTT
ncbi:hypothetical protein [Acidipila sp. EB88]|uniref:hypothetical protein n=1 Tax=Acidipila sp. EB88 TaxID=2305226 RepID=UPI000F5E0315|nr:hypothetical protein [Acidipila sp. EB88]RRA47134.1 hypothetical protein D1Y84_01340 [Acidipila sp. EB88]